jgi:hypothetical protein
MVCATTVQEQFLPRTRANTYYPLAAIYTTIGTICVLIAILTVDKMGRRTMFRECCMTPLPGTLILMALSRSCGISSAGSMSPP